MPRKKAQRAAHIDRGNSGGGGGGGGYDDVEGIRPPLAALLKQLYESVAGAQPNSKLAKRSVDDIGQYAEQFGFNSAEATQVMRVALRGGSASALVTAGMASTLIRCIRPAPNTLFDEAYVLIILASLGGLAQTGLDMRRGAIDDPVEDEYFDSDDEMLDEEEGRIRRRKTNDVRLQALALRTIVYMIAPPPILPATSDNDDVHGQTISKMMPASFLTTAARTALDKAYGVLFHYLDYDALRVILCHLLCLITRRKHVRHYRIVKVLALRAQTPFDFYVVGLLSTYAAFYPDMLFSESATARQGILAPHEAHNLRYLGTNWLISVYKLWTGTTVGEPKPANVGYQRLDYQRLVGQSTTTSSAQLSRITPPPGVLLTNESTLVISEIVGYRELGYRFDKVQMPDQLASALSHRPTALAILSRHTSRAMARPFARVHHWASSAIGDFMSLPLLIKQGSLPLERSDTAHEKSAALMDSLSTFVARVGGCDMRLQSRLTRVLKVHLWHQLSSRERRSFLGLLEHFIPIDRSHFEEHVLGPLIAIITQSEEEEANLIVHALAEMLRRWAAQDWLSIFRRLEDGEEVHWATVSLPNSIDYADTIAHTIARATDAARDLLARRPHSIMTMHACLSLHEAVFVEQLIGLHDFKLPPNFMLYMPGFTPLGAIMTLSRQAGLVNRVREMHQDYYAAKAEGSASEDRTLDGRPVPRCMRERRSNFLSEECSDMINDCVILLIDLVWRNHGFATVEEGETDIGLPLDFFTALSSRCQGRGDEVDRIGSASHSASLGVLMEAYANELARNQGATRPLLHGPLTPSMLKHARRGHFPVISHRDFRDSFFVTWLAQHGAQGISDLLTSSITRFRRDPEMDQSTVLA